MVDGGFCWWFFFGFCLFKNLEIAVQSIVIIVWHLSKNYARWDNFEIQFHALAINAIETIPKHCRQLIWSHENENDSVIYENIMIISQLLLSLMKEKKREQKLQLKDVLRINDCIRVCKVRNFLLAIFIYGSSTLILSLLLGSVHEKFRNFNQKLSHKI